MTEGPEARTHSGGTKDAAGRDAPATGTPDPRRIGTNPRGWAAVGNFLRILSLGFATLTILWFGLIARVLAPGSEWQATELALLPVHIPLGLCFAALCVPLWKSKRWVIDGRPRWARAAAVFVVASVVILTSALALLILGAIYLITRRPPGTVPAPELEPLVWPPVGPDSWLALPKDYFQKRSSARQAQDAAWITRAGTRSRQAEAWVTYTFQVADGKARAAAKVALLAIDLGGGAENAKQAAADAVDAKFGPDGIVPAITAGVKFEATTYQRLRGDEVSRLLHAGWRPRPISIAGLSLRAGEHAFATSPVELLERSGGSQRRWRGGVVALGSPAAVVGSIIGSVAFNAIANAADDSGTRYRPVDQGRLILTDQRFMIVCKKSVYSLDYPAIQGMDWYSDIIALSMLVGATFGLSGLPETGRFFVLAKWLSDGVICPVSLPQSNRARYDAAPFVVKGTAAKRKSQVHSDAVAAFEEERRLIEPEGASPGFLISMARAPQVIDTTDHAARKELLGRLDMLLTEHLDNVDFSPQRRH